MESPAIKSMVWSVLCLLASAPGLQAQFHNGQGGVNPQAVNPAMQGAASIQAPAPTGAVAGRNYSGGNVVLTDEQRVGLSEHNVHIGSMDGKPVDIWGRAIHHSDGSFTESKQDMLTNTLEQTTNSKNGVRLQRRMIMLDENGRPSEVMIYDGREQFKYRGLQIYDRQGRFSEEQIYDAAGTLIRRKVQEYTPQGQFLPVRSWDYVANVPDDLKLVITREDESPASSPSGSPRPQNPTIATTPGPSGQGAAAAPSGSEVPKKGLKLGRLFGGKKDE